MTMSDDRSGAGSPPGPEIGNVVAVGIDVVDLDDVERTLSRFGERYLRRVYSDRERAFVDARTLTARRQVRHLAACFAVKEATVKVIGESGAAVDLRCIHVEPGADSEHLVELSGIGARLATTRGIGRLSGSVEVGLAHAIAVVFGGAVDPG